MKTNITVFYLCDRNACPACDWPTCKHTSKPRHAINVGQILSGDNFKIEIAANKNGDTDIYLIEKEEKGG